MKKLIRKIKYSPARKPTKMLEGTALAKVATTKKGRKIKLGDALFGNAKDILANIPWWLPVALGVILLYLAYILSKRSNEEDKPAA